MEEESCCFKLVIFGDIIFKKSFILSGPANQWLLNAYLEAAVHPHCSVIGQEVFQSGVYPGDTDYRVFRDYGKIPGSRDLVNV